MTHHQHSSPFVTIVLSGAYVEVNETVPELCRGGAVVVHRAGEEHADRFACHTRCLNVELPNGLAALAPDRTSALGLSTVREAARGVVTAFHRDQSSLQTTVQHLRAALESRGAERVEAPPWLQRVFDEFPWTDAVPLREAAALAGLHETHFSRVPPAHRHNRQRISSSGARSLCVATAARDYVVAISRVAANAGLSDQSHLTRLFSERLGVSPAAYRQTFAR